MDTRTANREGSQVGLGAIEEKICALARYYAELGIEPPSKVEAKPQDFETQVRAVIAAGVPVLSLIYGIPPAEILDECRKHAIRTIGTATTPEEAIALEARDSTPQWRPPSKGEGTAAHFFVPPRVRSWGAFRSFLRWWMLFQFR